MCYPIGRAPLSSSSDAWISHPRPQLTAQPSANLRQRDPEQGLGARAPGGTSKLLMKEDQKAADCPPHPAACLAPVTFFLRAADSRGLKGTITAMVKGEIGAGSLRGRKPPCLAANHCPGAESLQSWVNQNRWKTKPSFN